MLYFAYGSNMDWDQMRGRCPSARFVGVAMLPDHKLAVTRRSKNRGCGVADAVSEPGSEVWGAVFEIHELEVGSLNTAEGYQPGRPRDENAYNRESRHVYIDGNAEKPLDVAVYLANRQPKPPRPNQGYKDLLLRGARHWNLPAGYIADTLGSIEVASGEDA